LKRNIPNQINDIGKLTAALRVASLIFGSGQSLKGNCAHFAERLVDAAVLASAINLDSNAAAARLIRKFFEISDLITGDHTALTGLGTQILAAEGDLPLRNAVWAQAMLRLKVHPRDEEVSHPYRIMLRLIGDHPGIDRLKLLLAQEAQDDSTEEYERISILSTLTSGALLAELGITKHVARNAVKILPTIAAQVGDIVFEGAQAYLKSKLVSNEDSIVDDPGPELTGEGSAPVEVTPETISTLPNFAETGATNVDLAEAIAARKARTITHHQSVKSIASLLKKHDYTLFERPFDCLGYKAGAGGILIEVKTLDGTVSDEKRQASKALGQLRGYRFFNVPAQHRTPVLLEVAAYSQAPGEQARNFMRDNGICTAWQDKAQWFAADLTGNIWNFSPDDLLGT
jgi:hypothetical protein